MFLYAKHISDDSFDKITIISPDTDVAVLCLSFAKDISSRLYFRTGTGNNVRVIDVENMKDNLIERSSCENGDDLCDALLGLHAFTGCDSISAFAGKGKARGLELLLQKKKYVELFKQFGEAWTFPDNKMECIEEFVCDLYGQSKCKSVNELRYSMYCAKNGKISSELLPPCLNALQQHTYRACYQAKIWRCALDNMVDVPDAEDGYGWKLVDGELRINWITCLPAPEMCIELSYCTCKKECIVGKCVCLDNNLPCTDMCKLDYDTEDTDELPLGLP